MRVIHRQEHKYQLDVANFQQVRNEISTASVRLDDFSLNRGYFVRSLYFDTDDYYSFYENCGGLYGRMKLRIRSYSPLPSDRISVELKTKNGNHSIKYSTFIRYDWYLHFMSTKHFPKNDNPVLIEFERVVHLRALRPKVIIEYNREGFKTKMRSNLRITFDSNIRSAAATDLFAENLAYRSHYGRNSILEIKCGGKQPLWLSRCIQKHGLKWVANSKYTQSIALARPDVINVRAGLMPLGKVKQGIDTKVFPSLSSKRAT